LKNLCQKCKKKETCKRLCKAALAYVNQDSQVYELQDETKIVVFPRWNEMQASTANTGPDETAEYQNNYFENTFSDNPENNPFSSFNPDNIQTQIFIHRFFKKWPYGDIALKFEKTEEYVKTAYFQGMKRMALGLEILDHQKQTNQFASTSLKNSEPVQMLNPAQKDFLLYTLFELPIKDIAEITDRNKNTVRSGIFRVTNYLKKGDYTFSDLATPGQWEKKTKINGLKNLKGQKQHD